MKIRLQSPAPIATSPLFLLALIGLVCWLPLKSASQTQDTPASTPDKTMPDKTKNGKSTSGKSDGTEKTADKTSDSDKTSKTGKTETPPPPGNPLQVTDNNNPLQSSIKPSPNDFIDRRHTPGPQATAAIEALPLFGYDFFQPARDILDWQRAYIKKIVNPDLAVRPEPGATSGRRNGRRASANKGNGTAEDMNNGNDENADTGTTAGRRKPKKTNEDSSDTESGSTSTSHKRTSNSEEDTNNSDTSQDNSDNSSDTGTQTKKKRSSDSESSDNQSGDDQNQNRGPRNPFLEVGNPIDILLRGAAVSVPPNYQLAPGDTLSIRYWSPTLEPITVTKTVDAQGQILLQESGLIVVRGKTLADAEKLLTGRLSRYYKNITVEITMSKLRTVPVTVTGPVYQPGTFQAPIGVTAFNVLYAAGGPTEEGSLRGIEVRRNGKLIGTLDLYKYQKGDEQGSDIPLQGGEIIVIPPRYSRVAVRGEVRQQAIYELLPGETLRDALRFAGGAKASGVNHSVRINSFDPGIQRVLRDIDITDPTAAEKQPIYDGDDVVVFGVNANLINQVAIEGAVDQPNNYPLMEGMRVSDLVARARYPLNDAYLTKADLVRWNPDGSTTLVVVDLEKAMAHDPANDLSLKKWDRLHVYSRQEIAWAGHHTVEVKGSVVKAGVYDYSQNMHVSDLLRMANGVNEEANLDKAFLIHRHGDDPPTKDNVNIQLAVHGDKSYDLPIQDNDLLVVYTIKQAQFEPDHVVKVLGEVVTPGAYPRSKDMTINDLLDMAGGVKPSAGSNLTLAHPRQVIGPTGTNAPQKVTLNLDEQKHRCAPNDNLPLQDGDVVMIQGIGGYSPDVQVIHVTGAVNHPGDYPLTSKNMRLSDAIRAAGGLRPEAFPQGAEFTRDPGMLASAGQLKHAVDIGSLNGLLNDSEYQRERARTQLEIIKATGKAQQDATGGLGALTGTATAAEPNAAAGAVGSKLANQDYVTPARILDAKTLQPDGSIAVNLPVALQHPGNPDDILLVDGDTIKVPETPTTVQMVGAVFSQRGVLYKPGAKLEYYLDRAGGFAPDAARDRIEIIRVGGGLIPARKVSVIEPGDVILVPTRVMAAKISSNSNGIGDFFKSLTNSVLIFTFATKLFGL